jgi:small-conductance mechanosensitive channel
MVLQIWRWILEQSFLWIESVSLFALIFIVGFLFKRYVARFVQNIFARIGLVFHDKIVVITNIYLPFWFFLIALYVGILKAPINTKSAVIGKIFYGVFAFSIIVLVASILSKLFHRRIQEKIISNILKFSIIIIGLVLILNQFGVELKPILAALGISSMAIGFALQDTLVNFFAGINILSSKQIARDDYIRLDSGQEGTVVEVNWRTTLIKEIDNTVIVVPNIKISSSIVKSYHFKKFEVTSSITCGVSYRSDLDQVEEIAKLAAKEIINKYDSASKDFQPIVQFTDFGDYSINFILFFRVKTVYTRAFIKSEVLKNLYKRFGEAKIEIPFPQRIVTINKN